jgi:hypothetical protein
MLYMYSEHDVTAKDDGDDLWLTKMKERLSMYDILTM